MNWRLATILTAGFLGFIAAVPPTRLAAEPHGQGRAPGDSFGDTILCCDLNLDGFEDLAIGATTASPDGVPAAGSVYVYDGATGIITRLDGPEADSGFGDSLACCDFDGDGDPDLFVGAVTANPGGIPAAGSVFVYSGEDLSLIARGDGGLQGQNFGDRIVCCDFDGDGVEEFVIASTFESQINGPQPGFISFYGPGGVELGTLTNGTPGDDYGNLIACGDLNGDGNQELAVSASGNTVRTRGAVGSVFVYRPGFGPRAYGEIFTLIARLDGRTEGDRFGGGLAICPLLELGRSQLLVGAPNVRGTGAVYSFLLEGGGRLRQRFIHGGETPGSLFGDALACCSPGPRRSANILVGAPGFQGGLGRAYALNKRGAFLRALRAPRAPRGHAVGQFGEEVACCDLDGDGVDEYLVGAPGNPPNNGLVAIYSGRTGRLLEVLTAPP